jgi:predicted histidine transporter YuiF (NhaC family)
MPGNPLTDSNWAPDLADSVERMVGKVRSVATDNAVKASRGIVFGILGLISLLIAAPLGIIFFTKFAQTVLSRMTRTDHETTVWLSYMITGGLLMLGGFIALAKRHPKKIKDDDKKDAKKNDKKSAKKTAKK